MSTPPPLGVLVSQLKEDIMAAWSIASVDYGRPLTDRDAPNASIEHEQGGPQYVPEEDAWSFSFTISGAFPMVEGEVWAVERDARFAELLAAVITGPAYAEIGYLPYLSPRYTEPDGPRDTYEVVAVLTFRTAAEHH